MRKTIVLLLVLLLGLSLLNGCGGTKEASPYPGTTIADPPKTTAGREDDIAAKQDDYRGYQQVEIQKILDMENMVVDGYAAVSGENYTDDATMYAALQNEIMPNLRELIGKAGKITPRHRELRDIHEIYISALNAELQGFILMLSALEKKDREIVVRANEKLDEAAKEMRDYLFELDEYARSIGLEP